MSQPESYRVTDDKRVCASGRSRVTVHLNLLLCMFRSPCVCGSVSLCMFEGVNDHA